jgi:hypothetical protein
MAALGGTLQFNARDIVDVATIELGIPAQSTLKFVLFLEGGKDGRIVP